VFRKIFKTNLTNLYWQRKINKTEKHIYVEGFTRDAFDGKVSFKACIHTHILVYHIQTHQITRIRYRSSGYSLFQSYFPITHFLILQNIIRNQIFNR